MSNFKVSSDFVIKYFLQVMVKNIKIPFRITFDKNLTVLEKSLVFVDIISIKQDISGLRLSVAFKPFVFETVAVRERPFSKDFCRISSRMQPYTQKGR